MRLGNRTYRTWGNRLYRFRERHGAVRKPHLPDLGKSAPTVSADPVRLGKPTGPGEIPALPFPRTTRCGLPDLGTAIWGNYRFRERHGAVRKPHLPDLGKSAPTGPGEIGITVSANDTVRLGNRTYRTWGSAIGNNRFRERHGAVRKPHLPDLGKSAPPGEIGITVSANDTVRLGNRTYRTWGNRNYRFRERTVRLGNRTYRTWGPESDLGKSG